MVGAVGLPLRRGNATQAGDRRDRRPAFVLLLPARLERGQRDQPIAGQGVFDIAQ